MIESLIKFVRDICIYKEEIDIMDILKRGNKIEIIKCFPPKKHFGFDR